MLQIPSFRIEEHPPGDKAMHDFEDVLGYHLEEPRKRNQRPSTDASQNNTKTTAPPSGAAAAAAGQKKRQATPSNKSLKQESAKHKAQNTATAAAAASSPALSPPSTAAAAPPPTVTPAAIKSTSPPLPPLSSSLAAMAAVAINQKTPATATNAPAGAALPAALFDGRFSVTPATAAGGMGQAADKKKAPRTATGGTSKRGALPTTIFAKQSRKIRKTTHGSGVLTNNGSSRKGAQANNGLPPLPTFTKIRLIIPSANKQNNDNNNNDNDNDYRNLAEKPTPVASVAKQHVHWASPPSAPTSFPPQHHHQDRGQETPAAALAGIVSPRITATAADTVVYPGVVVSKSTGKKRNINSVCPPLFKPAPPPNYITATCMTALPPLWEEQNRQSLPLAARADATGSGFYNNNNGIQNVGIFAHKYDNANGSMRGKVPLIFHYKPMMTERKQMQQAATMSALFSREKQLLRLWDDSQKENTTTSTTTTTSGYKNKGGGGVKDKKKSTAAGHHQQEQEKELSPALLRACELLRTSKV